jgi:hypothetical protein
MTPKFLWNNLMLRYKPIQMSVKPKQGTDYGKPRFDMYNLLWLSLPQAKEARESHNNSVRRRWPKTMSEIEMVRIPIDNVSWYGL